MNYEVEQKFAMASVDQVDALAVRLELNFSPAVDQVDQYFNHPSRDFAETDEAFRLRQVGEQNWVTYKGRRLDSATKTRPELELPLPDGRTVHEGFAEMWVRLGFRPVGKVSKRRRRAHLKWADRDCEVVHDSVNGLGDFVELEMICDASELDEVQSAITALATHAGLPSAEKRSYLELVLANER